MPTIGRCPRFVAELRRFLEQPEKPIILTVARLDERKNLEKLVEVYGQSKQLQELANLVMFIGTRDDYRDLPKAHQAIVENVFHLIDRYDLYGRIACPKKIAPKELPDLYRYAESLKGVFVNPALTEPFGLTLLEAGATGLPIVATNDGGPRDIIANCQNGLLVDPLNNEEIEHALLRTLTEPEQWAEWSANGIDGTRRALLVGKPCQAVPSRRDGYPRTCVGSRLAEHAKSPSIAGVRPLNHYGCGQHAHRRRPVASVTCRTDEQARSHRLRCCHGTAT